MLSFDHGFDIFIGWLLAPLACLGWLVTMGIAKEMGLRKTYPSLAPFLVVIPAGVVVVALFALSLLSD